MAEYVDSSIYNLTRTDLPEPDSWPMGAAARAIGHARTRASLAWEDGSQDDVTTVASIIESAVEVGNTYGQDGSGRRINDPLLAYYAANAEVGLRAAFDSHREYLTANARPVDERHLGQLTIAWANIYADSLVRDYYELSRSRPANAVDHQMMARREEAQASMTEDLRQMDRLSQIYSTQA